MPILIVEGADPLSDAALKSESESVVRNAQSDAGRVLKLELLRYCRGEVNGRSFLVAGHRGAGKTMMVADAVDKVLRMSRRPGEALMRPLPIFLHGPSLFETEPARPVPEPDGVAARRRARRQPAAPEPPNSEVQRVALRQIILCLHRAVSKEFVRAYRQRLVERPASWQPGTPAPADQAELAAQFEIELTEDPSAARLHELWTLAGARQAGVLFEQPQRLDQGPRELVALNGMCNAHQRISGAISALDKSARSEDVANETRSGAELRGADVVKPLASVLAGAAVAGGAAAGSHSIGIALVGGVVAALGSAVFFKASGTTQQRSGRQLDTTFIPDLSVDTLDRILPTLIQRLRDCGLAPVLIVDELDKVSDLAERFVPMMDFMKKLVAENIFSCFVTDRSYLEILRMRSQGMAHGRASSYFTHSLLVTFGPFDVDAYLGRLLQLDRSSPAAMTGTPGSPAGVMEGGYPSSASDLEVVEVLDLEVVKWVLRHRSRLHALGLAREVAALRDESGALHLRPGAVRTEYTWRVDVTFQVAIEFHLAQAHVQAWLRQRPGMTQTLLDALYYPTREWLKGSGDIAPQAGRDRFHEALVSRMNLGEVTAAANLSSAGKPLSDNDKEFLDLIVADLLHFLCDLPDAAAVAERWSKLPDKAWSPRADPSLPVLQSMLLGDESLVTQTRTPLGDAYHWRYSPTGETHAPADAPAVTPGPQRPGPALAPAIVKPPASAPRNVLDPDITATLERIQAIERNLWILFRPDADTSAPEGRVFQLLGDRLRVLPTTPAYSRVHSAILNVNEVLNGGGSRTTLIEDGRALNGFLAMLKASTPALIHALIVAAFCGDARGPQEAGIPVLRGLEGLSAGLGFAALDAEQLIWAMERMQTSAEKYGGRPLAAMAEIAVKRDLADLALIDDVLNAGSLGRRELPGQNWAEIMDSAWVSLRERAARFIVTEESPAASLHEILCAMAEVGPAQLIGLDLRAVTLQRWTTAFLCASGMPLLASPTGGAPPKWMVGYALNRLGAACIDGGRLADLAGWALGPQATAADANALHNAVRARKRGNDNIELSNRLALCVTPGPDAPMGAWTARPSRGMVLVVSADLLVPVLDTTASVLKLPLLVATAQGPGVRISPDEIVQTIAGRALVDRHVWVYRQRFAQMSEPSVIGPQNADDVLDYVQAPPTGAA
jgi:hypothetical protein